jgi:small nuclear ribonucleoprotein (snRNP)-like protein
MIKEDVMKKLIFMLAFCTLVIGGCSHYSVVDYRNVDTTNDVRVKLDSGADISGTVTKIEPHQMTVLDQRHETVSIQKSNIQTIKRKPPVTDDFGNGISNADILLHQTKRNKTIYGIGGGVLSFGISFFAGSLIGNAGGNGGAILAASTLGGTAIGTVMFLHAGQNKDRTLAIRKINEIRRSAEIVPKEKNISSDDMKHMLEEERKKQEELRKEREDLLKQLQESSGNP